MPTIKLKTFKGIMPKLAPKLLPEYAAQTARNCRITSGRLEPLNGNTVIETVTAGLETIFLWRYTDSAEKWLTWSTPVNVVQSPLAGDEYRRVYYTGDGVPKMKLWDGAEYTREMSMSIPDKPTVATTNIFSTSGVTLQQHMTFSGIGTAQTKDITGRLKSATKLADGKWQLEYDCDAVEGVYLSTSAVLSVFNLQANSQYLLTAENAGDGDDAYIPTNSWVDDYSSYSVPLYSGGSQYATARIVSIQANGRSYNWSQGYSAGSGTSWARCSVTAHTLVVTLEFTYTESANAFTQFQYYVQTWVDKWGNESPASDISAIVEWTPGTRVQLSALGTPTGDDVGIITKRRIYRSAAGTDSDAFYFVAEISSDITTYTDILRDADLGEEMPNFENPPDDLAGIVVMPGGFAAAYSGRDVYFSEPFLLQSWPTEYMMSVDDDVVALAVSGNDLVVLTKGNPYLISGTHPSTMTQTRLMVPQSCASARSVAYVSNGVVYASPDGLVMIQGGQARIITEPYFDRADWQALSPSSMLAAVHDNKYIAFFSSKGLIFHFGEGLSAVTETEVVTDVTALFTDLLNDALYMVIGNKIKTWDTDTSNPRTLTWRSGELPSERNVNWSTARVVAAAYPVTFRLYAQNAQVFERAVTSEAAFRISKLRPERVWSVEVEGAVAVDEIHVGTSMEAIR